MHRLILLALLLLSITGPAHAAPPSVVLVPTQGSKAWLSAERRLSAELNAMGFQLIVMPPLEAADHELARHATAFAAVAAVQALREGQEGLIRVWLSRETKAAQGGFRHVRVNLRGPEVVTHAVLPIVELVYTHAYPLPALAVESSDVESTTALPPGPLQLGAPVWGPPVRYHVRSEMLHAFRLGVGPWFSGGESSPAINLVVGMRGHYLRYWSIEPELFVHGLSHRVQVDDGVIADWPLVGGRVHLLFEPWPRSTVSLGFGPGLGAAWLRPRIAGSELPEQLAVLLSGRTEVASALAPYLDVLFIVTLSTDLASTPSLARARPDATLFRPAIDAQLAVDWHWE